MKRLQPVALTAVSPAECRLRCRPKFDQIGQDERSKLLSVMRQIAVRESNDDQQLESEFVFTFNENGAVLQDKHFFSLTSDDYGELWINRAVDCLALANERRVVLPDLPNSRAIPRTIFVDAVDSVLARIYTVVFDDDEMQSSGNISREYQFTVEGCKGNERTISWSHGSYVANWKQKNWTFASPPASDLEPLLLAIIRLDEAINLELMPYATS